MNPEIKALVTYCMEAAERMSTSDIEEAVKALEVYDQTHVALQPSGIRFVTIGALLVSLTERADNETVPKDCPICKGSGMDDRRAHDPVTGRDGELEMRGPVQCFCAAPKGNLMRRILCLAQALEAFDPFNAALSEARS